MKTSEQATQPLCWAAATLRDPDLLLTYTIMLAVLACGALAIGLTCRWYRAMKQPPSITGEALAQLTRALEEQDELQPEEIARIQAAIERQKLEAAKPPPAGTDETPALQAAIEQHNVEMANPPEKETARHGDMQTG